MKILENHSLETLNTLALKQSARYFVEVSSTEDVTSALTFARHHSLPWMILGSGSNLILSQDYPGLMIHPKIKGIQLLEDDGNTVTVKIAASENWHEVVQFSLQQGWYGLENLALIPGTIGAAPVQNIGAYGVELCDVFDSLEAWDEMQQQWVILDRQQCQFSYRDSLFKQHPHRFVIVSVTLRLSKLSRVNVQYQSLQEYFSPKGLYPLAAEERTPEEVFKAVVAIRQSKLPDPAVAPNAGSFFKNPLVSNDQYENLLKRYSQLVSYPADGDQRKLAAGWLIEQAGWKGKRQGNLGIHSQQALVLVNYGGGSGEELLQFANTLCEDIKQRFGVTLEIEPVVV